MLLHRRITIASDNALCHLKTERKEFEYIFHETVTAVWAYKSI